MRTIANELAKTKTSLIRQYLNNRYIVRLQYDHTGINTKRFQIMYLIYFYPVCQVFYKVSLFKHQAQNHKSTRAFCIHWHYFIAAQAQRFITSLKTGCPGFIIPNKFVIGYGPGGDDPGKRQRNTQRGWLNYLFVADFHR